MKYSETIDAGVRKTERNLTDEQAENEAREARILSRSSERDVAMGGMNKIKKYAAIGALVAGGTFMVGKALNQEDPNPYGNSGVPEKVADQTAEHEANLIANKQ